MSGLGCSLLRDEVRRAKRTDCPVHAILQVLSTVHNVGPCCTQFCTALVEIIRPQNKTIPRTNPEQRAQAVLFAFVAYLGMMTLFVRSFVMKWCAADGMLNRGRLRGYSIFDRCSAADLFRVHHHAEVLFIKQLIKEHATPNILKYPTTL